MGWARSLFQVSRRPIVGTMGRGRCQFGCIHRITVITHKLECQALGKGWEEQLHHRQSLQQNKGRECKRLHQKNQHSCRYLRLCLK